MKNFSGMVILALILGAISREIISVIIVDNQKEPTEKQMIGKALVFTFVLIPSIFIGLCVTLNEFVFKTPLVRSFNEAGERSKVTACESRRAFDDNKLSDECNELLR